MFTSRTASVMLLKDPKRINQSVNGVNGDNRKHYNGARPWPFFPFIMTEEMIPTIFNNFLIWCSLWRVDLLFMTSLRRHMLEI